MAKISGQFIESNSIEVAVKMGVRVVATSNLDLTGDETIDSVNLSTGDRVLVAGQTDASENGIYIVNESGAWTRATDADISSQFVPGFFVFIHEGSTHGSKIWAFNTQGVIVLDTTNLVFEELMSGGGGGDTANVFHVIDDSAVEKGRLHGDNFTGSQSGITSRLNLITTLSGANENITIATIDDNTNNAVATNDVVFETGSKTNGTGGSGNFKFFVGSSAAGARGNFEVNAEISIFNSSYLQVQAVHTGAISELNSIAGIEDTSLGIEAKGTGAIIFYTDASTERFRISEDGSWGLGSGADYGNLGQVLTSNGSGQEPTWEDPNTGSGVTLTSVRVKNDGGMDLGSLPASIDSVTLDIGDLFFFYDNDSTPSNGVYVYTGEGNAADRAPGWNLAEDFLPGKMIIVLQGDVFRNTLWNLKNTITTLDSDSPGFGKNGFDPERIPFSLFPKQNGSGNVGSDGMRWANGYFNTTMEVGNGGSNGIRIYGVPLTTPSGASSPALQSAENNGIALITQNNGNDNSDPSYSIYIETGNKIAGTGNSGDLHYYTGYSVGGNSGGHFFTTGVSDADGVTTGGYSFLTGEMTTAGSSTGGFTFTTGAANNVDAIVSGGFTFETGLSGSNSGQFSVFTGMASGGGTSGLIQFRTGDFDDSVIGSGTGLVSLYTGNVGASATAPTGDIEMFTGLNLGVGDSGSVRIGTGSVTDGTQGTIYLTNGTEGTAGHVWTSTDTAGAGAWMPGGAPETAEVVAITTIEGSAGTMPLQGTTNLYFSKVGTQVTMSLDQLIVSSGDNNSTGNNVITGGVPADYRTTIFSNPIIAIGRNAISGKPVIMEINLTSGDIYLYTYTAETLDEWPIGTQITYFPVTVSWNVGP